MRTRLPPVRLPQAVACRTEDLPLALHHRPSACTATLSPFSCLPLLLQEGLGAAKDPGAQPGTARGQPAPVTVSVYPTVALFVIVNGCQHKLVKKCELVWVAVIWDSEDPLVVSVCVCACARWDGKEACSWPDSVLLFPTHPEKRLSLCPGRQHPWRPSFRHWLPHPTNRRE